MRGGKLAARSVGVLTIFAALVAAGALLWPVMAYVVPSTTDASEPDPVRITLYDVDLTLAADGSLHAVETLTTQFPCCRHGIFRFFDVVDRSDARARLVPRDVSITQDGQPVPVEWSWQRARRYRVAKIGDPDKQLLPGSHVYRIDYTIDGAIGPADGSGGQSSSWSAGDGSQFLWDVVPGGWQMAIDRALVHVHLPAPAGEAQCASLVPCRIQGLESPELTIEAGQLPPFTSITVRTDLAVPTPDRRTVPWSIAWDGVLGRSVSVALLVGLLSVVALVGGRLWERRTREQEPGFPVMYGPPEGVGPVQASYVMNERTPDKALSATLLYAAEQGLVTLQELGPRDWLVTGAGTPDAWGRTDPVTRAVGDQLMVTDAGTSFHADGSTSAGERLNDVVEGLPGWTRSWALESGQLSRHPAEDAARFALVAAAAAAAAATFFHPFGTTLLAFPLAAFVIGAVGLVRAGVGTRRTTQGRELWSRAGGFRRLLSTDSAQQRFDFSAHKELYTAFIPYAVGFGCAEEWARKYEQTVGEPAPVPVWYAGSGGGFSSGSFSGFESSLNSSIGAYEATQRSSSSGGGGFSGGGGGGGGGSW